jgi:Mg/Co/Ni transporter MgtE
VFFDYRRGNPMPDEQKQLSQQILLQQIEFSLETGDSKTLAQLLNEQRSSDIAEVAELLDNEQRRIVFDVLDKPISAEVLEKVNEAIRAEIFDFPGKMK